MTTQDMLDAIKDVRQPNLPPHQRLGVMLTVLEELVRREEAATQRVYELEHSVSLHQKRFDNPGEYR